MAWQDVGRTWLARGVWLAMACIAGIAPATAATLREPDALVAEVFALADARLALMPDVAAAKWIAGQAVTDRAREAIVIRSAGERALALGLAREPVEALFAVQVDLAREQQEALHAAWSADRARAPGVAPSLTGELRPKIDQLTGDLLAALYLSAPFLADADLDAVAHAALPATRWRDAERTRFVAALRAVRYAQPRAPARAAAAGVLRIGTTADYAPFAVAANEALTGSDIELSERLAAALGLRAVFIHTRWARLVDDLEADRFDIAAGGITVTDARRTRAAFSLPVAHGGKTAIGRCTDRQRFARWEDIDHDGTRVVENVGGLNEQFARSRLRHATLSLHADNRTVMDELVAGRADVMFTDDTEVILATRRLPALCRLLPSVYDPADKALLLPHDGAWTAPVDAWLRGAIADGLPSMLLERHLVP
jgi:cyclohexadienyl dehydratase